MKREPGQGSYEIGAPMASPMVYATWGNSGCLVRTTPVEESTVEESCGPCIEGDIEVNVSSVNHN